ncbi:hypothetical protein HDU76_007423 [Blyttiomyces sp. JEL0837]|nr:hypothetical protein HDU76_007423 [Blyttiomyces sp. JEL0837]
MRKAPANDGAKGMQSVNSLTSAPSNPTVAAWTGLPKPWNTAAGGGSASTAATATSHSTTAGRGSSMGPGIPGSGSGGGPVGGSSSYSKAGMGMMGGNLSMSDGSSGLNGSGGTGGDGGSTHGGNSGGSVYSGSMSQGQGQGQGNATSQYRYTREFILSLYDPGLQPPADFDANIPLVTVNEPLEPLANIPLTELEKRLLSMASVNSDPNASRPPRQYSRDDKGGNVEGGGRGGGPGGRGPRPGGLQTGRRYDSTGGPRSSTTPSTPFGRLRSDSNTDTWEPRKSTTDDVGTNEEGRSSITGDSFRAEPKGMDDDKAGQQQQQQQQPPQQRRDPIPIRPSSPAHARAVAGSPARQASTKSLGASIGSGTTASAIASPARQAATVEDRTSSSSHFTDMFNAFSLPVETTQDIRQSVTGGGGGVSGTYAGLMGAALAESQSLRQSMSQEKLGLGFGGSVGPIGGGAPPGITNPAPMPTLWCYKDPSGVVQGPFTTEQMQEWYSKHFFSEDLPIKKQNDLVFEPLSRLLQRFGRDRPFPVAEEAEMLAIRQLAERNRLDAMRVSGFEQYQPEMSSSLGGFGVGGFGAFSGTPAQSAGPIGGSLQQSRFGVSGSGAADSFVGGQGGFEGIGSGSFGAGWRNEQGGLVKPQGWGNESSAIGFGSRLGGGQGAFSDHGALSQAVGGGGQNYLGLSGVQDAQVGVVGNVPFSDLAAGNGLSHHLGASLNFGTQAHSSSLFRGGAGLTAETAVVGGVTSAGSVWGQQQQQPATVGFQEEGHSLISDTVQKLVDEASPVREYVAPQQEFAAEGHVDESAVAAEYNDEGDAHTDDVAVASEMIAKVDLHHEEENHVEAPRPASSQGYAQEEESTHARLDDDASVSAPVPTPPVVSGKSAKALKKKMSADKHRKQAEAVEVAAKEEDQSQEATSPNKESPSKPAIPAWKTDSATPKLSLKQIQEAEQKEREEREAERAKKAHMMVMAQAQMLAEQEAAGAGWSPAGASGGVWGAPVKPAATKTKSTLADIMQEEEKRRKKEEAAAAAAAAAAIAVSSATGGKRYADLASSATSGVSHTPGGPVWGGASSAPRNVTPLAAVGRPSANIATAAAVPKTAVVVVSAAGPADSWNVVGKTAARGPAPSTAASIVGRPAAPAAKPASVVASSVVNVGPASRPPAPSVSASSTRSSDGPSSQFLQWCRQALRPLERSTTATVNDPGWSTIGSGSGGASAGGVAIGGSGLKGLESQNSFTVVGKAAGKKKKKN